MARTTTNRKPVRKPMSHKKVAKMSTSVVTPAAPATKELNVKVRSFNLDTFEKIAKDVTVSYAVPQDMDSALELAAHYDVDPLDVMIAGIERYVKSQAKKTESGGENTVPLGLYRQFVNFMRSQAKFSNIEDRKAQTDQIEAFIASDPIGQKKVKLFAELAKDDYEEDDDSSVEE